MNAYTLIAVLAFVVLALWPIEIKGGTSLGGSLVLALIWPVILVGLAYLLIKKKFFHRHGLSKSPVIAELEFLGCLVVTSAVIIVFLYAQNNPFAVNLIRALC